MATLREVLFTFILVFCAALTGIANASASTFSQSNCYTGYGPNKPFSVPTISKSETLIIPVVVKTTYVPSTAVTPMPITSTSTVLSTSTVVTTLSQSTDTFSTTTTFFSTTTLTSSATTTTTVGTTATVSVDGGTTTVPTSAGFTPLASVVAANGGTPSKRKRNEQKLRKDMIKREPQPASKANQNCVKPVPGKPKPPPKYPELVFCNTLYEVVTTKTLTSTASTKSTVTAAPATSTVTSTSTITSTSTATIRDASTTTTFSTTSTIATTTTTTITNTETSTASVTISGTPVATAYAACQSNNLITDYAPGQAFTNAASDYSNYIYGTATSGYDCCVQCVTAGYACGGSLFYLDGSNQCVFLYTSAANNQCNPGGTDGYLIINDGNAPDINSNSNCGMFRINS